LFGVLVKPSAVECSSDDAASGRLPGAGDKSDRETSAAPAEPCPKPPQRPCEAVATGLDRRGARYRPDPPTVEFGEGRDDMIDESPHSGVQASRRGEGEMDVGIGAAPLG
jgi:hypothetical protein